MKNLFLTLFLLLSGFAVSAAAPSEATQTPTREPDVIFVPTPQDVVEQMLKMANLKKNQVLYDLGSGDGRVVVTAAEKFGARAVGFDINPERVQEGLDNIAKANKNRTKNNRLKADIKQADIFTLDLSEADVVFLYLLPSLNVKLLPQLAKLKPGAKVVSHSFSIEGIQPDQTISVQSEETGRTHEAFLWTAPLQKTQ